MGWGEGAGRSVGAGKRARLPCACAGPRARPPARPLARAPVGACGGSALPGGGVSPGEPLGGSRGGGCVSVHAGGLGGCGAGRRAPRGTGSTCLRTDAGSRCSRGEQGTRCERGRETERPVSVRLPLFVDASGCLRGKRVAAAAASRPGSSPAPRRTGGKTALAPPPVLGHRLCLRQFGKPALGFSQ